MEKQLSRNQHPHHTHALKQQPDKGEHAHPYPHPDAHPLQPDGHATTGAPTAPDSIAHELVSTGTPCPECDCPSLLALVFPDGSATYCPQCGYRGLEDRSGRKTRSKKNNGGP